MMQSSVKKRERKLSADASKFHHRLLLLASQLIRILLGADGSQLNVGIARLLRIQQANSRCWFLRLRVLVHLLLETGAVFGQVRLLAALEARAALGIDAVLVVGASPGQMARLLAKITIGIRVHVFLDGAPEKKIRF